MSIEGEFKPSEHCYFDTDLEITKYLAANFDFNLFFGNNEDERSQGLKIPKYLQRLLFKRRGILLTSTEGLGEVGVLSSCGFNKIFYYVTEIYHYIEIVRIASDLFQVMNLSSLY